MQEVVLAQVGVEDEAEELMSWMDFSTVPRMAELAGHYAEAEDSPMRASSASSCYSTRSSGCGVES
ncbi:hypothetical protein [Gulosibacter massiliensis]|uniref:hypothetical protein n=1 Tax=Gulosibacter massiliensis TaxID=2479839 RepID=UPI000F63B57D|nr:hypothetical protein [Gulosibacter massiliensis]